VYKKYVILLGIGSLIFLLANTEPEKEQAFQEMIVQRRGQTVDSVASVQRMVDYTLLEQDYVYQVTEKEYEALLRIVEAEAGGEDEEGKLLVANVVLNRVRDKRFPNTILEVIRQNSDGEYQFSPVGSGRYETVNISRETTWVVERALKGEDISKGALYFAARSLADPEKMQWFDECLTFVLRHGGHEFFK